MATTKKFAGSLVFVTSIFFFFSSYNKKENYIPVETKKEIIQKDLGRELASIYCASCHLFPEPGLLDKVTWKDKVLPNMAARMGLQLGKSNWKNGMQPSVVKAIENLGVYPKEPTISKSDWESISKYYLQNAPNSLQAQEKSEAVKPGNFPFKQLAINIEGINLPQVTLLEFYEEQKELYVGDGLNLFALNTSGNFTTSWTLNNHAVDLEFKKSNEPWLLNIGKLAPSDESLGTISPLNQNTTEGFSGLIRPVDAIFHDLDGDGAEDLVICHFGFNRGKLVWYEGGDPKKEHVLSSLPGARKAVIEDLNADGKPDILALFTQGMERITAFLNKGGGEFEAQTLLQFDPIHGTNYFEYVDLNGDGHGDLLVSNGDNRDYSPIAKPYHGLRIYLNDGSNEFNEAFFFPMYDVGKVMAYDFDNDGDLDIIAASLFAKYDRDRKAEESVLYLENKGNMDFSYSYLPDALHGNWLTMEIGDFNQDGKKEVFLGSFFYNLIEMMGAITESGQASFPSVVMLTMN